MRRKRSALAATLFAIAIAPQLTAQVVNLAMGNDKPGDKFTCPANAVHDTGNLPKFANVSVNDGVVFLNDRVSQNGIVFFAPPDHKIFVITDIVVQNRAPGDSPVGATDFSRISLTAPTGADVFFSLVGNDTLSQHFRTGLLEPSLFRFYNTASSSVPFVEVFITGVLRDCGSRVR